MRGNWSLVKQQIGMAVRPLQSPLFLIPAVLYFLVLLLGSIHLPLYNDELSFQKNVASFAIYRTMEPFYANYPTFYSYFVAVPIYIVYVIIYIFFHHFPWSGLADARLFALVFQTGIETWVLVGRITTILFATAIAALVYRYCVGRLGRPARMLALLLLLASPYAFYIFHTRYALPDILVAFLVTVILLLAARHLEAPSNKILYLAGFLAGIAASAKLNGAIAVFPLLVLPWIVSATPAQRLRRTVVIALWAGFGFFVGSPCNILKPGIYATGFGLESKILYSSAQDFSFQWLLLALWREDAVMTVLILAALVFSLWRHSKMDMVFHALLIPAVICLGGLSKRTPHYLLFLLPWLCVLIGQMFDELLKRERPRVVHVLVMALFLSVVAYASYRLGIHVLQYSRQDNRNIAREWMKKKLPGDERILVDQDNVPRLSFIDIGVMPMSEYIQANPYREIVKRYARSEQFHAVGVLSSFAVSLKDLKGQGWKYFVTADDCFEQYLQDPAKLDAVERGDNNNFIIYLQRRAFYMRLFRESVGVQEFRDGSGPGVYIFRLQ